MLNTLGAAFRYVMAEGDKRTFVLLLTDPWWPFLTFFLYVLLVKVVGPAFMKNRAPYTLKTPLLLYNAFQVALSAYLFVVLLTGHHLYYIAKYTELLDTVFFVLRKKYSQVTFLHVYHHGTMPFFTCLTLRFSPGSSVSFIGFLNTFVHIIMYGYYLLAAMGPQVQKYLWWKKYITSMQLIQFVTLFVHFTIVLGSSCNVPKGIATFVTFNIAFNFALFYHFYRREYQQKMRAKKINSEGPRTKNELNLNASSSNGITLENIRQR